MKLLILLSVIACSYADKLDRTYLPPLSAATAGGSPGSIAAPGTESELGLPKGTSQFGQSSRPTFGQSTGFQDNDLIDSSFGQESKFVGSQTGPTQSGRPEPGPIGSQYNQFGSQSGSPQFGQTGSDPTVTLPGRQPVSSNIGQPGIDTQYNQEGPQSGSLLFGPAGSGLTDNLPGFRPGSSNIDQQKIDIQYNQGGPQSSSPQFGQAGSGPADNLPGRQPGLTSIGQPGINSQYNQGGSPSGSPQFGQAVSGPADNLPGRRPGSSNAVRPETDSQYNQGGLQSGSSVFGKPVSPIFGKPVSPQSGPQYNPTGSQLGLPQRGQPGSPFDSQYNPGGQSNNPGQPGFDQGNTDFNKSPAFGGQLQGSQPDRIRASIDRNAETLHYENDIDGDRFAYSFETSNGIAADEAGVATNGVRAKGGFSYTGDDGQVYSVRYTADENGYVPQGDHLPTPHPIPEEILKSLELNAKAAAAGTQEGAYNPQEDSEEYDNGAFYPGQSNTGKRPGYQSGQAPTSQYDLPESSSGAARPQDFDSKYGVGASPRPQGNSRGGSSQYTTPQPSRFGSTGLGSSRFPSDNQRPGSQYGGSEALPSNLRPSFQDVQSPVSQYNNVRPQGLNLLPQGTVNIETSKGPQLNSGYNYNAADSSLDNSIRPTSPSFGSDGNSKQKSPSQFGTTSSPFNGSPSQNSPYSSSQYGRPSGSFANNDRSKPTLSQNNKYPTNGSPFLNSGRPSTPFSNSGRPFVSQGVSNQVSSSPDSQISQYNPNGVSSGVDDSSNSEFSTPTRVDSGYQYNNPSAQSSNKAPGSQIISSPTSQYNTPSGSPFSPNKLSEPKDYTGGPSSIPDRTQSYDSQSPAIQYTPPFGTTHSASERLPTQGSSFSGFPSGANSLLGPQRFTPAKPSSSVVSPSYGSFSPSASSNIPSITDSKMPTRPQGYPTQSSLSPSESVDLPSHTQPGYYQRPQFGSAGSSRPTASNVPRPNSQATQEQDTSGYKYPRPQIPARGQQNTKYPNLSGDEGNLGGSSSLNGQQTSLNNNLSQRPSGDLSGSIHNERPTESEFSKLPGFTNQAYPFDSESSGLIPETPNQRFPISGSGQYKPSGLNSKPTTTYPKPGSFGSVGTTPPSGQVGSESAMLDSAPYQYNRPIPEGSSVTEFKRPGFNLLNKPGQLGSEHDGSKPDYSFSEPTRPGQIGSISNASPSKQEMAGQIDYQNNIGVPGQDSSKPQTLSPSNVGAYDQKRPGQGGSEFSRPGQITPNQEGYQPSFGPQENGRPGQGSLQPGFRPTSQNRPSQGNYQPSRQNELTESNKQQGIDTLSQTGSDFGPSSQNRPDQSSQTGRRPGFGFKGQDRPTQSDKLQQQIPNQAVSQPSGPSQTGSRPGLPFSGQDKPGQLNQGKPREDFSGPRQPQSFSKEEGYKY